MKIKLLTICLFLVTSQVFAKFDKNKKYYDEFGFVIKYFPKCSSGKYNKLVDGNEVYFTCKHNIHGVITKEEHKEIQGKEWWKDHPLACLANKNKNFYMNQKEKYKGKCSYRGYGLISYEKFKKIQGKEAKSSRELRKKIKKCAEKSAKAKSEFAAKKVYRSCLRD